MKKPIRCICGILTECDGKSSTCPSCGRRHELRNGKWQLSLRRNVDPISQLIAVKNAERRLMRDVLKDSGSKDQLTVIKIFASRLKKGKARISHILHGLSVLKMMEAEGEIELRSDSLLLKEQP